MKKYTVIFKKVRVTRGKCFDSGSLLPTMGKVQSISLAISKTVPCVIFYVVFWLIFHVLP